MKLMSVPYRFIAIEGNIGVGKTTLCNRLAEQCGCTLLLEEFTENPFLPSFYTEPDRYAFPVELYFMTERHKQLLAHFEKQGESSTFTVADYFFVKTLLFAQNNLSDHELLLFRRLFKVLNDTFPKPDLLLYLHRPVDVLLNQIKNRGRSMEQSISAEYLEGIQDAYMSYLKKETDTPVVVLELGDADFQRDDKVFEAIHEIIQQEHQPGLKMLNMSLA